MSKHLKGELSESTKNTYKTRINKLIAYGYDVESMTISNIDITYRKIVAIEKQWNGNKKPLNWGFAVSGGLQSNNTVNKFTVHSDNSTAYSTFIITLDSSNKPVFNFLNKSYMVGPTVNALPIKNNQIVRFR